MSAMPPVSPSPPPRSAQAPPADIRREAMLAAGALLGMLLVAFPDTLLGGRIFFERDIHLTWMAHAAAFVRAAGAGRWPLWDAYYGFGQPHWAVPQTQTLYPPTLLLLVLPPGAAFTISAIGHLVFAGLGVFLLLRRAGASFAPSLLGGGLVALSGPYLSMLNVWHQLAGAAWIPWLLLLADRALQRGTPGATIAWGAAAAMQVFAGSGEMSAFTALLNAAQVLLAVCARAGAASAWRRLRTATAAGALAVGLSAALWWPALALAGRSVRRSLPDTDRGFSSVHPLALAQAVLPAPLDALPFPAGDAALASEIAEPFLASLYLGLPAIGLVAAALVRRRCGATRAALALLLIGVLLALGRHLPLLGLELWKLPPLAAVRFPAKAMALVALGWALLAGLGADALARGTARRAGLAGAALASVLALGFAAWSPASGLAWAPLPARSPGALVALTLAAGLALLGATRLGGRRRGLAIGALCALALLDLVMQHAGLNPTAPAAFFATPPPALAALGPTGESIEPRPFTRLHVWDYRPLPAGKRFPERDLGAFYRETPVGAPVPLARAAGLQAYLYPSTGSRFGIFGSFTKDLMRLYPAGLHDLTLLVREAPETPGYGRLLRLAGVTHVLALHEGGQQPLELLAREQGVFREPIRVFRAPDPLPRSYAVGAARVADGASAYALLLRPDFDPAREIVLPEGAPRAAPGFTGTSRVTEMLPDRVRLDAELSQDGYVVLLDAWDPGWRASVDGRPAPVLRANVAFRAVPVPAGRHRVELAYRPAEVKAGVALSLLTLAAAALGAAWSRRRTRDWGQTR
jgi:hypothetical protein